MAGHKEDRGNGRWLLTVSAGFDAKGNRIRHRKTFKGTEKQAEKALAMFVTDVERDNYEKPQKMICRDLFRRWMDTYGKFNFKNSTYDTFERYLFKRVCTTFIATVQVKKLSSTDFYKLYNELREKYNYSNKTLLQIHRIMHSAFTNAMTWPELQLKQHPMNGVVAPEPIKKKIVRLNEKEAVHFLKTALKHAPFWFFVFLSVAFTSGLRRGEICGLRYMDVKPDINKLNVWQNVTRGPGGKGLAMETPKSGEPRYASVPQDTIDLLAIYREQVESVKGPQDDSALIFSLTDDKPIHPDYVSHYMKEFREKHSLPDVTIHGGRHTFATILINKGVSLKAVSEHLGHSTTQITDTIYTEVWEEQKKATTDELNGLIPKFNQEPEKDPTPTPKNNVVPFRKKSS